jgi:hypothetical protein
VKGSSLASRPDFLLCPLCEAGNLCPSGDHTGSARCASCGEFLGEELLKTLKQLTALPDALGSHACECGHPQMRRLPGGVFHCPACGSEVLPLGTPPVAWKADERSEAYRAGWLNGRFGERGSFVDNPNLAKWGNPSDRLDYYRGHRAGREAPRAAESGRLPKAHRGLPR